MAKHQRQVVREAAIAALRLQTQAQDRVFPMRVDPWAMRDLPGISVYTTAEESEVSDLEGEYERKVTVDVKAVVSVGADGVVGDDLDVMALQIEAAMLADPTLDGAALGMVLTGTTVEFAEESRRLLAAATLSFDVTYQTAAPE